MLIALVVAGRHEPYLGAEMIPAFQRPPAGSSGIVAPAAVPPPPNQPAADDLATAGPVVRLQLDWLDSDAAPQAILANRRAKAACASLADQQGRPCLYQLTACHHGLVGLVDIELPRCTFHEEDTFLRDLFDQNGFGLP